MKKRTVYLGVFTAAAAILGYVESLLPLFAGIPGMKLGLPNLIIVILLYTDGGKEALAVSVARILLIGFLFGNLYSILFSLAGGLCSLTGMWLLKKLPGFSVFGVSVAGGVLHNAAQLCTAAFVIKNSQIFYYLPVLLTAGIITGFLIGFFSNEVLKRTRPFLTENKRRKKKL